MVLGVGSRPDSSSCEPGQRCVGRGGITDTARYPAAERRPRPFPNNSFLTRYLIRHLGLPHHRNNKLPPGSHSPPTADQGIIKTTQLPQILVVTRVMVEVGELASSLLLASAMEKRAVAPGSGRWSRLDPGPAPLPPPRDLTLALESPGIP